MGQHNREAAHVQGKGGLVISRFSSSNSFERDAANGIRKSLQDTEADRKLPMLTKPNDVAQTDASDNEAGRSCKSSGRSPRLAATLSGLEKSVTRYVAFPSSLLKDCKEDSERPAKTSVPPREKMRLAKAAPIAPVAPHTSVDIPFVLLIGLTAMDDRQRKRLKKPLANVDSENLPFS
eukprot:6200479-Pleurochrysis_carterae.AAC.2